MTTPPGWYRDPVDPNSIRWWDGTQWTEQRPVAHAQPAATAGQPAAAHAQPAVTHAQPGITQMTAAVHQGPDRKKPSRLLVPIAVGVVSLLVGGVGGYLLGSRADDSAAITPGTVNEAAVPGTGDPTVPSGAELGIGGVEDDLVLAMIREAIPAMAPMDDDLIVEQADLICGALRGLPAGSTADFARGFATTSQLSEGESYELIGFSIAWKCPEVS